MSKSGGTILLVDQVFRSSVSMSSTLLKHMDPVLEFPRSAANCRVHVGRGLDIPLKTNGSE